MRSTTIIGAIIVIIVIAAIGYTALNGSQKLGGSSQSSTIQSSSTFSTVTLNSTTSTIAINSTNSTNQSLLNAPIQVAILTANGTILANNAVVNVMATKNITILLSQAVNATVKRSDVYINAKLVASALDNPFTYYFNTTNANSTDNNITVKSYTSTGNLVYTKATTILLNINKSNSTTIPSNEQNTTTIKSNVITGLPPSVSISSPANYARVSGGGVNIIISVSDQVPVKNVTVYINGKQKAVLYTTPYYYEWNTKGIRSGDYNVTVTAVDTQGLMGNQSITLTK